MSENVPNSESPTLRRSQTLKNAGIQIYVQPMRFLLLRWAGTEERVSMRVNVSGDSTESNGIQVL